MWRWCSCRLSWRNQGSWNKSCHLNFSLSKLKKVQERAGPKNGENMRKKPRHRNAGKAGMSISGERSQCLFSLGGDDENKFHCLQVLKTDRSINVKRKRKRKRFWVVRTNVRKRLVWSKIPFKMLDLKNRNWSLCTESTKFKWGGVNEKMHELSWLCTFSTYRVFLNLPRRKEMIYSC